MHEIESAPTVEAKRAHNTFEIIPPRDGESEMLGALMVGFFFLLFLAVVL